MSFFYGDVKTDELKTANGLQLQGGTNNSYTLTLDTHPTFASNYTLNFPLTLGSTGQVLSLLDESGNLGFSSVSGGAVALNDIDIGTSDSNLATSSGNINFKVNTSNTIMIIDNITKAALIPSDSKISFGDNTANIYGSGGSLYMRTNQFGSISMYGSIYAYGYTTITGNASLCNYQLSIDYENSDINFKNSGFNKDTVFKLNSTTEVLRLIGSNNVVRVPGSLALMDDNYSVNLQAHPSTASSYTLNFPTTVGAQNEALVISSINGTTANLGFSAVSGGTVKLNDIDTGDAQSTLSTSTGNILIKATNNDVVLKAGTNSNVISGRVGALEIFQVNSSGIETKTGDITSINNLKTAFGLYAGTGYTELQILPGVKNHNITNTVSTGNIDFNLNTSTNVLQLNGTDNSVRVPGSLALMDGTNSVKLQAHPSTASSYTLNFPTTVGAQNEALVISSINGSTANLGFSAVSGGGSALDDITTGDAQSTLSTSTGNILIKATNNDVVLKAGTNSNVISGRVGALEILQINSSGIETKTGDITSINSLKTASGLYIGTGYTEFSITESAGQVTMDVTTSDKDLVFTVYDGIFPDTEVMRLDGSESSLLMANSKQLQFLDTTTYIQSSTSGTLNITAPTLDINASTEVNIDNDIKIGGKLYLGTNQDELEISDDGSNNITFKNQQSDADIIFNLSDGGVSKDILKLDASDNVAIATNMNTSNTFSLSHGTIDIAVTGTEVLDFAEQSDFIITIGGAGSYTLTLASKNVNRVGQQGSIMITQTSTTNSLTWTTSNGWYFPSATAPTLSSGTGNYDVFSYIVVEAGGSKKILVMDATNFQAY